MSRWVAGSVGGGGSDWFNVKNGGAVGDGTANDTAILQSIIDGNAGRIIYFPEGTYNVSQLLLPSNTHLELGEAVIRRTGNTAGASTGATIRNADHSGGTNTNITVRGGTITANTGASGRNWSMKGATNVRVQDLQMEKGLGTFSDWMFHFEGCTNVRVDNCRTSGGTAVGEDGLHIKSTQNMVVNNCIFEAGDDALVLVHEFNQTAPIRNITITNCVLSSRSANALRISVWAGETQIIEDVTISNITIRPPNGFTPTGNCVTIGDQTGGYRMRRINLSNFVVNATGYAGNAVSLDHLTDSTLSNWRVFGASNRSFLLNNCQGLELVSCVADAPAVSTGNPQWAITGGSTFVRSIGCVSRESRIWGWVVNGAGTSDITFVGCEGTDSAQADWIISDSVARVSFVGCYGDRIEANATTPPTKLRVVGCHLTNATTPIVNPPTGMVYLGNTDGANRGHQFDNSKLGFYGTTPIAKPTGVAVTAAGVHAALVSLGLIAA